MALSRSKIDGEGSPSAPGQLPLRSSVSPRHQTANNGAGGLYAVSNSSVQAAAPSSSTPENSVAIKAVVTVKPTSGRSLLSILTPSSVLDGISDWIGKSLHLQLVAAELDPKTGLEKDTIEGYARPGEHNSNEVKYEAEFEIKHGFGEVGAVLVTNEHHTEMFLEEIVLTGFASGAVIIPCNSWVHAKSDSPEKRIFFANKEFIDCRQTDIEMGMPAINGSWWQKQEPFYTEVRCQDSARQPFSAGKQEAYLHLIVIQTVDSMTYLPSQTPSGLKRLREEELENLRGNGEGERKSFERIYDYDVYNDLGNPDLSDELKRPVLGGKDHPYPRRCRTGRPRSTKDPASETRSTSTYVPRDEQFLEVKQAGFTQKTVRSVARALLQSLDTIFVDLNLGFPFFSDVDNLFNEGLSMEPPKEAKGIFKLLLPRLVKAIQDRGDDILLFEPPAMMERDRFSWLKDEEFARQTIAGLNPYSIQLVTEFPFVSKLDPKIYGPAESAITKETIECQIKGYMTVEEALNRKRLFVLDYHDLLLPYVSLVRDLEGTTLYGSRTVFFLTNEGTLRPLAIELTRPASPTKPQWKKVFTPGFDNTDCWVWKFAKAHVCAHDMGYHELVVHWLRTHSCVEPYIIAANRQLSAMHPISRLMRPHFRYTMEINALAREFLINGGGIIELSFSPKKYSMQLSSDAYAKSWRFDMEGLPGDLIRRGMAVEDPTAQHGLKLTIEDYPFAADGLLVWSAIEKWVSDYVAHYYTKDEMVSSDTELQAWWTEVRTKGHADKKDEPWWPSLNTPQDLTQVLTTIVWVASAHHAAVNFGQYSYGGYFPNRPSILRTNMPVEDEACEQFKRFWERPERELLEGFPSQFQATLVMAILDVLSTHSQDEEYLGELPESAWTDNPTIRLAFEKFNARLKEIEATIDERNNDRNLRNRTGAGMIPYELLKPFSKPGVTGRGIPNSISI
ncbi:hypothetical protein ACLOJK_020368 [Asimina triloba]